MKKNVHHLVLAVLTLLVMAVSSAQAANILIIAGSDAVAISAAGTLNTELTTAGHTVTQVNGAVPGGAIVGYTQIYDLRYNNAPVFSAGEQSQYLTFLQAAAGNVIFLMGENSGGSFLSRNTAICNFITLAGGGTVPVPSTTKSTETVNSPFNTTPNTINSITYAAVGVTTSAGNGYFATSEPGGTSGGALYFNQGALTNASTGGLVVVFDVNFIYDAGGRAAANNEIKFRQNLEALVTSGGAAAGTRTPASGVPTMTEWGMIVFALLAGLMSVGFLKRQQGFSNS